MTNILAVDDDKNILKLLKNALMKDGYHVTVREDPRVVPAMDLSGYELIILDVMMPGLDGFTLCGQIRDRADCPILFLTAKTMEADIMKGFGIGGDDYITKPFGIGELRARVLAHLRRERREKKNALTLGKIQFQMLAKKVLVGQVEIPFTKSEYAICEYLALNRGQVFSKERIYEHVFGYDGESDSSVITEHVKNIRSKLAQVKEEPLKTVWGIGYRWE